MARLMHRLFTTSPRNVRELENVLERALIMSGDTITVMDLPEELIAAEGEDDSGQVQHAAGTLKQLRDHAEREVIVTTLKRH